MPTSPADLPQSVRPTYGRLLLVVAVMWSTTGLFVKSEPLRELPGPLLACLRAFFAASCLVPFVRPSSIRFRGALVPMAICFAAMNVLFLSAMTWTTAAAAVFLQYTATPWAFLLGLLLLKERWQPGGLVAVACAIAGIAWIVVNSPGDQGLIGNLLAIGSGVTFAGVIVSLRRLRGESPVYLVLVNQTASCLVLLPWLIWQFTDSLFEFTSEQWLLLAAFGIVQMSIPYLLFTRGLQHVRAHEAALIVLLEPVLTPVWVWLAGWETAASSTWIGGGLILLGLVLRYTFFARRDTSDPPRPPAGP